MAKLSMDPLIRRGDAILYGWGEAKRNGELEAFFLANASALSPEPTIRAPGTHSNPVLAILLAAEDAQIAQAVLVQREVDYWRANPDTALWADVAEAYYASPYKLQNKDVAQVLKVSLRTVEGCRSSLRRVIAITIAALQYRPPHDEDLAEAA